MNKFIFQCLLVSIIFSACNGQANNRSTINDASEGIEDSLVDTKAEKADSSARVANAPVITWKDSDTYNFGTIKDGDKVTHDFKFTNTGKSPLIISNVQATCGCTTPEYTKTPINPGNEGTIKVIYNSSGQGTGPKHKTVTITSNASKRLMVLNLKGSVK